MFGNAGWVVWFGLVAACDPAAPDRAHVEMLFLLDPRAGPATTWTPEQRQLGAALFEHDVGGSACVDCHPTARRAQDGRVHGRNTPTLVDVSRQLLFGWDGVEHDLATMVRRELTERLGVADDGTLARTVRNDDELVRRFTAAFPEPGSITVDHAAAALAAQLSNWRSRGRWDRYVEGDDAALSPVERHGLQVFLEVGCATCHGGRTLGGSAVFKLGLAVPFATTDPGRAQRTGKPEDQFVFRAPMLRLAVHTAPYLHDGSIAALPAVIKVMARHELGKEVTDAQVAAIAAFLQAAGDIDATGG